MTKDTIEITAATDLILSDVIRESAHPLTGAAGDYDTLMKLIGHAGIAPLGKAS
ncbi:MAG: hypothetical protein L0220_00615 [Acidobacteria bacterium]|nr:hypothetical protein [Acidobacteriota bacterium]